MSEPTVSIEALRQLHEQKRELLDALIAAYDVMLTLPYNDPIRIASQAKYALCRDVIVANASLSPRLTEIIQDELQCKADMRRYEIQKRQATNKATI